MRDRGARVSEFKAHSGRAWLHSVLSLVYADLFSAGQIGSGGEPTASVTAPPEQISFLGLSPSAPAFTPLGQAP